MEREMIISLIPLAELEQIIGQAIEEKIKSIIITPNSPIHKEQYATRKEVCAYLRISLPTLNNLSKNETIESYRIGGRVLYKWDEVEAALTKVNNTKYKRKSLLNYSNNNEEPHKDESSVLKNQRARRK